MCHRNAFNNIDLFQKNINYVFKNENYLKTALSHTSFVNETNKQKIDSNERQEFLGDSVLSLVVADYLFKHYPRLPEGELTKLRASLVCEKTLCQFADKICLGDFLALGKGENSAGGRKKSSILADAFEALIAAIYLDAGLKPARDFILGFILNFIAQKQKVIDYKTILQEIVQKNHDETLSYRLVSETGPDHDKNFTVELILNNNVISQATAGNKKSAEQLAAKEALNLMGIKKF